jgi:hypothetical protein
MINSPLDIWLAEINPQAETQTEEWDPGFDAGRQIVIAHFGPWQTIFERPDAFKPRFYHHLYPIPIQDWQVLVETTLYDGYCRFETTLSMRLQATLKYVIKNSEHVEIINQYAQSNCESLIRLIVDQELRRLTENDWVEDGLELTEKAIQNRINETLITQYLQCTTQCFIRPHFGEIEDDNQGVDHFARESLYLKVLKKNFEFQERLNKERFEHEQIAEQSLLEKRLKMIEQRNKEDDLKRIEQALIADNTKRQLEEKQQQQLDQFQLEERLHLQEIRHRAHLKEVEQRNQLELEKKLLDEKLAHQKLLKEKERALQIQEFKLEQAQWNETKEHLELEKINQEKRLKQLEAEAAISLQELKLGEELKLEEKLHAEKLRHQSRLKDIELDLQIDEQRKRYEATLHSEEFLRRDIELLILEKQRSDLLNEIKSTESSNE